MTDNNMLNQTNRLKKVRDFNLLMKYGHWVNGEFLDIKYLKLAKVVNYFPKKEDAETFKKQLRVAFSVGLKIDKRAVKRNKVKRQLSEVVRLLIKDETIGCGYYLMFKPKKEILDKTYAEISEEVKVLLNKIGILDNG